jgi:FixJ family two-component response regulator
VTETAPGTVFVVDDDASVRKSLVRLLKSAGFAAERAPSTSSPSLSGTRRC